MEREKAFYSPYDGRWQMTGVSYHIAKKKKGTPQPPQRPPVAFCYSIFLPGGLHATVSRQQRRADFWTSTAGRSTGVIHDDHFKATWHYEIAGYGTPDNEEFEDESQAMAACEKMLRELCLNAANALRDQ